MTQEQLAAQPDRLKTPSYAVPDALAEFRDVPEALPRPSLGLGRPGGGQRGVRAVWR